MAIFRYFGWAFLWTLLGLVLGGWLGFVETGGVTGLWKYLFICCILGVLEISLSFDNAIVNARILSDMDKKWRKRFLTWGIVIAVFGMRIIFPLIVVAFAAWISPWKALRLAVTAPHIYAEFMIKSHLGIVAFGGAFLLMVAMKYFFDAEKTIHWIGFLEKPMQKLAVLKGVETAFALAIILVFASLVDASHSYQFLSAAIYGLLVFLLVEFLGKVLDASQSSLTAAYKGGAGAFLYLEILDASFSFDGVVGAFALSTNLFVIAIGLGIGALYVRAMTIMLVEKGTLAQYRYLEHGAFYAIFLLAIIMFMQTLWHISEVITGFIGAGFILAALYASIVYNRRHAAQDSTHEAES
ncbi:DUF475 domain-containing protein [Bartonella sp. DGB2]|uniref:DUF475 domain-containing protein n=1 Tax=Bartonella sp. DGB2 TaxID=3388426 RepID=UPI003990334D